MIGDAIVWWRACAIWPHKAVYAVGSLLIGITLGMCLQAPSSFAFRVSMAQYQHGPDTPTVLSLVGVYMTALDSRGSTILALFISGNAYAFAAGFLSLATNVLATTLIAYKVWCVHLPLPFPFPLPLSLPFPRLLARER